MERIQSGKYVELGFDLYRINEDGTETLMHQTDAEEPESLIFGVSHGVIRPLEKALDGLAVGDSFDVKADAEDAFGMPDPEWVSTLPRDIFLVDGKFDANRIFVDAELPMLTEDGQMVMGKVKEVTDEHVVMDFNHPLAGYPVHITGKVLVVRDATPEELQPQFGCGCGCGHDHEHEGCCHEHEDGGDCCHGHHHHDGEGCCHK